MGLKKGFTTRCVSLVLVAVLAVPVVQAQESLPGVYIIFDASGSMWGQLPDQSHKVTVAKQVLQDFVAGDLPGASWRCGPTGIGVRATAGTRSW